MERVNEQNFFDVLKKENTPAVVDFFADWCGPCQMLSPVIDKLSEEYAGKVRFYQCNVDECMGLCIKYGIETIPRLFFFEGETKKDEFSGYADADVIRAFIEKNC